MVYQYVESRDRTHRSANAAEDIRPGNLIYVDGNDAYNATSSDGADGVALGLGSAAWVAEEYDHMWRENPTVDLLQNFTYSADDEQPLPYADLAEDGQRLRLRLPEDPGDGSSAPDVSANSVLGVTDKYPGRLVEEGYTDGSATTYDTATGNFVPIGNARGNAPTVPVNEFHKLVHLITDDF